MGSYCGLICLKQEGLSTTLVQSMVDTLAYWEPDRRSVTLTSDVGFGHLMRHDTPESTQEVIPFENELMIFVGECRIDNREELASELNLSPFDRDSLFVMGAYKKWGETCCKYLMGDFSFVIWDKQKRVVFCGRDHLGIKPFYYFYDESIFAFSTEIKAFFCIPKIQKIRNETQLNALFIKGATSILPYSDDTLFENIVQLTPGHCMMVSSQGLTKFNYWNLDRLVPVTLSDDEIIQTLKQLVAQAVACRMRTSGPRLP